MTPVRAGLPSGTRAMKVVLKLVQYYGAEQANVNFLASYNRGDRVFACFALCFRRNQHRRK